MQTNISQNLDYFLDGTYIYMDTSSYRFVYLSNRTESDVLIMQRSHMCAASADQQTTTNARMAMRCCATTTSSAFCVRQKASDCPRTLVLACLGLFLMIQTVAAADIEVRGVGASLPALVYEDLIFAYQFVNPRVKLSYHGSSSGSGKCRIQEYAKVCNKTTDKKGTEQVDFAGSDSLLSVAEYSAYPDLQMFPWVAGGIVPVYNLPALDPKKPEETLVLDRLTLAYIFIGNITQWNDQRILDLQSPAVRAKLEAEATVINVVVRQDRSGSTEVFTKSIDLFAGGGFKKYFSTPSDDAFNGNPKNQIALKKCESASGVAACVLVSAWSIGYSSIGEALVHRLPVPLFSQNVRQKTPIKAAINSIAFAMLEKGLQFGNNGDPPDKLTADIMDASGDSAWPISTFTYVIIRNGLQGDRLRQGATCANVQATVEFWNWVFSSELASRIILRNHFVPLPDLVKQPVLAKLHTIKCNGEPALKDSNDRRVQKSVGAGIIDPLIENIMELYVSVYKSVDPTAEISLLALQSSQVDTSKRLQNNEAFKIVIGDEVYQHDWVKEDIDKVLGGVASNHSIFANSAQGAPVSQKWSEIHPPTGEDTSLVLPWMTFAVHFVYNIPGADQDLVLTPTTLKKILNGQASKWTDSDIIIDNPWISSLSPVPGFIQIFARDKKDTIYDYLSSLSDGFDAYEKPATFKYSTWEQITSVASRSPGAFGYGPFLGSQPSHAKFAKIKWKSSSIPLGPSFSAVMACTQAQDAFGPSTRQFTPNPESKGCYPLTLTANAIFHHSYSNLEEFCFNNENTKSKGAGLLAVQFWKFLLEKGADVEKAIVSSNAVPLVHTTNNTDQVRAALWMASSIQCGHPPDVISTSISMMHTIIGSSVAGALALLVVNLVVYVVHRNLATRKMLRSKKKYNSRFKSLDKDGDGKITEEEFVHGWSREKSTEIHDGMHKNDGMQRKIVWVEDTQTRQWKWQDTKTGEWNPLKGRTRGSSMVPTKDSYSKKSAYPLKNFPFKWLDKDEDGKISQKEYEEGFHLVESFLQFEAGRCRPLCLLLREKYLAIKKEEHKQKESRKATINSETVVNIETMPPATLVESLKSGWESEIPQPCAPAATSVDALLRELSSTAQGLEPPGSESEKSQPPATQKCDFAVQQESRKASKCDFSTLKMGCSALAAEGLRSAVGLDNDEVLGRMMKDPEISIECEILFAGLGGHVDGRIDDIDNYYSIKFGKSGDWEEQEINSETMEIDSLLDDENGKAPIPDHVKKSAATGKYHGGIFKKEDYDSGNECKKLKDFHNDLASVLAGLLIYEVLILRLYTSTTYRLFNGPMRKFLTTDGQKSHHPLRFAIYVLTEGIKKLRAVEAKRDPHGFISTQKLWRGFANTKWDEKFLSEGGTEMAVMSTTSSKEVALSYASSESPLVFKYRTVGLTRGVNIQFLSLYPKEVEFVYPPLTFLSAVGKPITKGKVTILEVKPQMS